jgi:DNA-directed RNA polymerase specialized sigma subunit
VSVGRGVSLVGIDCPRRVIGLDQRIAELVMLRFFAGMTQSQIAAEIGISQMHVSRLIRRSLENIRAEIAADEEEAKAARG